MKKLTRKLIALAVIATMFLGMSVCAFAGEDKLVYTCLGDSNAAGYRTTGYVDSRIPAPNAYHSLIANELGAELINSATSGFRSDELRYMLEPGYELDWTYFLNPLMEPTLKGAVLMENIKACKADNNQVESVEAADVVTIQVGVNDILCDALGSGYDELSKPVPLIDAMKEMLGAFGIVDEALNEKLDSVASVIQMVNFFGKFLQKVPSAVDGFCENWDAIIKNIYRINPDVKIVAISIINPFNNVRLTPDSKFKIGKLLDGIFEEMNKWIAYESEYADTYYYCDITDTVLDKTALSDDNFRGTFIISTHPTDANHKDIAARIVEIIKTGKDSKANPETETILDKLLGFIDYEKK